MLELAMQTLSKENIVLTEISESAYKWLTHSGQRISKNFLKSEIITHPDYPALTSLTDLLDAGNLDYIVQRASFDDSPTFNFPCIVHLNLSNGSSGLYQVDNLSALEKVKAYWNGIILHALPESNWQHHENDKMLLKTKQNTVAFVGFGLFLMLLSIAISAYSRNPPLMFAWLITAAAGILIGFLLLSQELGLATEIVQKVCGIGGNKTGCANVLNSKHAKGKFGISIAMVAFVYFVAQWFFFAFNQLDVAALTTETIIKLGSVGILIAAWSIYTQKFIIKHWCTLCLGLASLLLFQFALSITDNAGFRWEGLVYFAVSCFLIMVLTLPIKKLITKLNILKTKERELTKWKKDTYLFLNQWSFQPEINCESLDDDLELANAVAPIKFTIACNPYCNPCARAHKEMEQLLDAYEDYISVKVRFRASADDEKNKTTQAVNTIFNASKIYGNPRAVIHEWFNDMDLKKFVERYPKATVAHNYNLIIKQNEWADRANIRFTPTIFLNNRELPKRYNLLDLMSMVPEIYDQIINKKI